MEMLRVVFTMCSSARAACFYDFVHSSIVLVFTLGTPWIEKMSFYLAIT